MPADTPFNGFMIVFIFMFIAALIANIAIVIAAIRRNAARDRQNRNAPRLTVQARVIAKRMDVRRHQNYREPDSGTFYDGTSTTYYFATFEVESGDRMELELPGEEYGLLVEGDTGVLNFQGTVFLSFARSR
ncbi:MAG: DUF2500 domain-containing protein [Oscillospiraceae bacterium]|nr:DUF2500 domain-containing protein [Oscillospiraceae bacterium]